MQYGKVEEMDVESPFQKKSNRVRRKWIILGALLVALLIIVLSVSIATAKQPNNNPNDGEKDGEASPQIAPPLHSQHGTVAADHPMCSEIGTQIMKEGGNAIDAVVATCICEGVVNPFASGIGGGAVMLLRLASGKMVHYDMREIAPLAATQNMYVPNPSNSSIGPLSVAVPGEVKGLELAWKTYGSGNVTWERLFRESIKLARDGFKIHNYLAMRIGWAAVTATPSLMKIIAPNGVPLKAGEIYKNPQLANTLETIALEGADVFYHGRIGSSIVNDVRNAGGILTEEDLHNFNVTMRKPTSTFYNGHRVYGTSPPFSGGPCIIQALNILERYKLRSLKDQGKYDQAVHWIVESLKFSFSNRMALADPDFVNVTDFVSLMTDKNHAAFLRQRLSPNATFGPIHYLDLMSEMPLPIYDEGTSHISIVDRDKNAVALTTTVNLNFGSQFVSESTGIILNDEMDDFSTPNVSNAFLLPPSESNFIVPKKKPLSSMSPTIVTKDGKLFLVLGGSGGSTIITGVLQTLLNVIDFDKNINEAINLPRIHCQLLPNRVSYEIAFDSKAVQKLRDVGNTMLEFKPVTAVQGVMVLDDGTLHSASDYRKQGAPAGY